MHTPGPGRSIVGAVAAGVTVPTLTQGPSTAISISAITAAASAHALYGDS